MRIGKGIIIRHKETYLEYVYVCPAFDLNMKAYHVVYQHSLMLNFIIPDDELEKGYENV